MPSGQAAEEHVSHYKEQMQKETNPSLVRRMKNESTVDPSLLWQIDF